ncbi:MAG: hypothetical protein A3C43_01545 [Candidatus Schekmanbacteria bacterium RIFCSPHIGHO2_02_FULL_38_11]|uniref:Uncharacterized protein n=1 Tax=Candidatus Schekmanbacteria bacterium RIFCSPLOWO2_12_FULL_38_15 TaxID=1817883 RepID=A0A1F7SK52_9BACT|nr:MAG: hypothetical protein A2043_10060 [Candidatus Schekmanbacteria bacterium GWA2_38_9]OGL48296.1 MAG: hypothetical protein A3H37_00055 [Candidatus Schekmanbacteria bacterium RIFCSPLOWO2_02_FULL_38_14]OGL49942.1 MAG: hypothetical protein A3C43_01545 [Candidatus Schekmanbacteria bacterium RIFCSPHIGHO2_02_FULL_38_11]OGL54150.1 MAG: hypothetical protein A3G31_05135 [Candidatus Schekmanbacteria bacterium RIFCSPLOWO2_12_FULL_38_15]
MTNLKLNLKVDKELIIISLLVIITGIIYFFVNNQRAFLNFFYLPVLLGAFFYGKKHGIYSAILSVLIIFAIAYFIPDTFSKDANDINLDKWLDVSIWGGFLILTGYTTGFLYEKKEAYNNELRKTYSGIITMLSVVIDSVDKYTQNHSYRVSRYAEKIAIAAGLPGPEVEDIMVAALLHDIGKIGVGEEVLNKIGNLSEKERKEMVDHTGKASELLEPLGGRVLKILPLILNHHERYDGKGYYGLIGGSIPIGARIIAVADVYDALITDRPYRKALSPEQAKNEIINGSETHFDPEVIKYFQKVFSTIDSEEEGPMLFKAD